jgi:hypothetical protein
MDLDVVYLETCACEQGTLRQPGVGAVNGVRPWDAPGVLS